MIPFELQKWLFRAFVMLVVVLFVGVFAYAVMTETGTPPPEGGKAPFAESVVPSPAGSIKATPLDQPHRTLQELEQWVTMALSEVLNLDSKNYDSQISAAQKYFSAEGFRQFQEYMTQAGIRDVLVQGDLKTGAFAESLPLLLNNGAVAGVYRWLYEVPVTIGYTSRLSSGYDARTESMTRHVTIRVQLARIADMPGADGLRIESWSVSAQRR